MYTNEYHVPLKTLVYEFNVAIVIHKSQLDDILWTWNNVSYKDPLQTKVKRDFGIRNNFL